MRGETTPDFVQSSLQDLIQNTTVKEPLINNSQGFIKLAEAVKRQEIHCPLSKSSTKSVKKFTVYFQKEKLSKCGKKFQKHQKNL